MPLTQKLIITFTSALQRNLDKPKDPVSNGESFLKGEKTTGEDTVWVSDWLTVSTRKGIGQTSLGTPNLFMLHPPVCTREKESDTES